MQTSTLFLMIVALTLISYFTGRHRAQAVRQHERLLALPGQYGSMTAMWSALPALILLLLWMAFEPGYLNGQIIASLPAAVQNQPEDSLNLLVNNVLLAVADGGVSGDQVVQNAANAYISAKENSRLLVTGLVLVLCASGIVFGLSK